MKAALVFFLLGSAVNACIGYQYGIGAFFACFVCSGFSFLVGGSLAQAVLDSKEIE